MLGSFVLIAIAVSACSAPSSPPPPPQAGDAPAAAMTATPAGPVTPPTTDDGKIASAMSAGPPAVAQDATIIDMDAQMQVRTLRPGTNGWTCMPDMPNTPGADPMCIDQNGLEWAKAWMAHADPPAGKMAFGYMLAGGSDASNTDPFATTPSAGQAWIDTGPHVMVFNIGDHFAGYPTTSDNPKAPYVMWPGTKYAHLMLPVK
jgi:hypothetical protein